MKKSEIRMSLPAARTTDSGEPIANVPIVGIDRQSSLPELLGILAVAFLLLQRSQTGQRADRPWIDADGLLKHVMRLFEQSSLHTLLPVSHHVHL